MPEDKNWLSIDSANEVRGYCNDWWTKNGVFCANGELLSLLKDAYLAGFSLKSMFSWGGYRWVKATSGSIMQMKGIFSHPCFPLATELIFNTTILIEYHKIIRVFVSYC